MRCLILLLLLMVLPVSAFAHEMRPAYLAGGNRRRCLRRPLEGSGHWATNGWAFMPGCPQAAVPESDPIASIVDAAYTEHWTALCSGGLKGQTISIDGLRGTLTDVLARIAWRDGSVEVARLTPEAPSFVTKGAQTGLEVAGTYFRLGVDHILSGFDHLLFVFALILLIHDRWMLFKTITAFTVAHSITLAGATLGYVQPAPEARRSSDCSQHRFPGESNL